ncbi:MAG: NAD(+)/NADH kinase [Planctomycetes bacterium]|nr:NAD(+)/NADH kinase [Planctomycetota bacterium]
MIERVGIVAKTGLQEAASHLPELAAWLDARHVEPVFESDTAALSACASGRRVMTRDDLPSAVDLVLVLGGDGTLLGMAKRIGHAKRDIPILGVNFGHLGFLTEITYPELYRSLESALAGSAAIDERMMLRCSVRRTNHLFAEHVVLNDVVITRGALSRIIELSVSVDGQFVATFHADGVIISTPTGSTAYNLSAGGPIVHPDVDAFVLTPIAPHMLTNRPVVIPGSAAVDLQPFVGGIHQESYLLLDGQTGFQLVAGDVITVARSPQPARIIRGPGRGYFEVLRQKLKWASR